MSLQALTWVVEDAPDVPPHCVSTLMGLANHASRTGQNAYPSIELLAFYARKTDRAVQNDLKQLEDSGLIRRGDQRAAFDIPERYRPVVYDLAMERQRETFVPRRLKGAKDYVPSPADSVGSHEAQFVPPRDEVEYEGRSGVRQGTKPTAYKPVTKPITTTSSPSSYVSSADASRPALSSIAPHCNLCDEEGTAHLVVDGEQTSTQCRHNGDAANVAAVRARWAVTRRPREAG